ncbi:sensor domain-containing diguanylate cyclase [Halobacillus litoralis]|uniref:sensor domain-containing diguanylate cyclase n=1 Tax=Halobacillus litoralis TaxID=45668 RepID=UPI001CFC9AC1|nr:sensor domain-containing diguanylate cyclase [Halobacillus litoralis]WLR46113.1 sensor domain-containing diguanylate cyclase [Halobacillus litoralis]
MTKQKKYAVWFVWASIWPASLVYLYLWLSPVFEGNRIEIAAFIILASIVALFPLQIGDHPVFFTHGIAFAVFLYYGLFIEIIVSQVAILALMAKMRLGRTNLHRLPINLFMFLLISVVSAGIYYALGGTHGPSAVNDTGDALPIVSYALSQIVLNQFSIKFVAKVLYHKEIKWLDKGFVWELLTASLVLPIGFVLYMVYSEFGMSAIFFVGIPFIFISGMLMLYHNSNQVNTYLKKTSIIGHELTGKLGVKEVLDIFVDRLSELLPVDYIYVYDVSKNKRMELIRFFDRSGEIDFPHIQLSKGQSISGNTWQEGKSVFYRKKTEWSHLENQYTPDRAETVLSVPVERNGEIVGVITIYSNKKRAFLQFQFMILNILGNYLGVAIDNARHYEKTKAESEHCALTGLYNYRYFEDHIVNIFEIYQGQEKVEPISLVLLDIDHFKRVNDTYGHESGNTVLAALAERLQEVVAGRGTLARYGGEEFVLLLPGHSQSEALEVARSIRKKIIQKPFSSNLHIHETQGPVSISVTASIGVATSPDHCEGPFDLIRQADRAMYIGAKQRGRNRVASYEELIQTVQ